MDAYASFAQRIADSVTEVRGCLILSRDGFVLGSYPDEDEGLAKSAWLRFAGLGESERGVVEFPTATWAFVHRGPYSAFAVAVAGVRPGVLIDRIEDVLAEAERSRGQVSRGPEQPDPAIAPRLVDGPRPVPGSCRGLGSRAVPRSPPQVPAGPPPTPAPVEMDRSPEPAEAALPAPSVTPGQTALDLGVSQGPQRRPEAQPDVQQEVEEPEPGPEMEPEIEILLASAERVDSPSQVPQRGDGDESEVDRVLLAKEFSGLLQVDRPDDEVPG